MTVYGSTISFCVYDKFFRLSLSYLLSLHEYIILSALFGLMRWFI